MTSIPVLRKLLIVLAAAVSSAVLLAQASASAPAGPDCAYGSISAIGPVDEHGNGDTTPDVRCIQP